MFALLNQNQEREEVRNVYNSAAQLRILASNILHALVNKVVRYNGVPRETYKQAHTNVCQCMENVLQPLYLLVWWSLNKSSWSERGLRDPTVYSSKPILLFLSRKYPAMPVAQCTANMLCTAVCIAAFQIVLQDKLLRLSSNSPVTTSPRPS